MFASQFLMQDLAGAKASCVFGSPELVTRVEESLQQQEFSMSQHREMLVCYNSCT